MMAPWRIKMSVTGMATLKLKGDEESLDGIRTDFQILQSFFRLAHGFLYLRLGQQIAAMMRHIKQGHVAVERS